MKPEGNVLPRLSNPLLQYTGPQVSSQLDHRGLIIIESFWLIVFPYGKAVAPNEMSYSYPSIDLFDRYRLRKPVIFVALIGPGRYIDSNLNRTPFCHCSTCLCRLQSTICDHGRIISTPLMFILCNRILTSSEIPLFKKKL